MELKKYLIFITIFSFTEFLHADIVKPSENLTAYDVVKIQLTALKNNNKPKKIQASNKLGYLHIQKIKNLQVPMKGLKKCYLEFNIIFC